VGLFSDFFILFLIVFVFLPNEPCFWDTLWSFFFVAPFFGSPCFCWFFCLLILFFVFVETNLWVVKKKNYFVFKGTLLFFHTQKKEKGYLQKKLVDKCFFFFGERMFVFKKGKVFVWFFVVSRTGTFVVLKS